MDASEIKLLKNLKSENYKLRKSCNDLASINKSFKKMLLEIINDVSVFERDRIAKYLHDEIGAKLGIVHLNLTKMSRNSHNQILCDTLTKENIQIIDSTIKNVRSLSKNVWNQSLSASDYKNTLLMLCKQINASKEVHIKLIHFPVRINLSGTIIFDLSKITCEAINNIIKHAKATKLSISIKIKNKNIETILAHNGNSFSEDKRLDSIKKNVGSGLKNMQSIIERSYITVSYLSSEKGAQTIILMPHEGKN